ncbi:14687_t:CDS:2, partial [Ambispora leptoticha]
SLLDKLWSFAGARSIREAVIDKQKPPKIKPIIYKVNKIGQN